MELEQKVAALEEKVRRAMALVLRHADRHGAGEPDPTKITTSSHVRQHAMTDALDHTGAISSTQHGSIATGNLHPEYTTALSTHAGGPHAWPLVDYIVDTRWTGAEGAVINAITGTKIFTTGQLAANDIEVGENKTIGIPPGISAGPILLQDKSVGFIALGTAYQGQATIDSFDLRAVTTDIMLTLKGIYCTGAITNTGNGNHVVDGGNTMILLHFADTRVGGDMTFTHSPPDILLTEASTFLDCNLHAVEINGDSISFINTTLEKGLILRQQCSNLSFLGGSIGPTSAYPTYESCLVIGSQCEKLNFLGTNFHLGEAGGCGFYPAILFLDDVTTPAWRSRNIKVLGCGFDCQDVSTKPVFLMYNAMADHAAQIIMADCCYTPLAGQTVFGAWGHFLDYIFGPNRPGTLQYHIT